MSRTTTFSTPGQYNYTLPSNIGLIYVVATGAPGAAGAATDDSYAGGTGGAGLLINGTFAVAPGSTIYAFVGGQGQTDGTAGINGGGSGGAGTGSTPGGVGGGGGGSSDVRTSASDLSTRLIVAGGGGGGAGGSGSAIGGSGGSAGLSGGSPGGSATGNIALAGGGGQQTTGGAGGTGGTNGVNGAAGQLGVGGNGAGSESKAGVHGGSGGGGGGYYGGGGGAQATSGSSGGGGGGSSFPLTATQQGTNPSGNGVVQITYIDSPEVTQQFGAATVPVGGTTTLTLTLTNPTGNKLLPNAGFTVTLSGGLVVATPSGAATTCTTGSLVAESGSSTISLTGVSLAVGASCSVTVNVTGTAAATAQSSVVSYVTEAGATQTSAQPTASLPVLGPVVASKTFVPETLVLGQTTTLQFSLTNPNEGAALTNVQFDDTLQYVQGSVGSVANVCGGTLTTNVTDIVLTGATLAAGATCTFAVALTGAALGSFQNELVVYSSEAASSAPALANVTVLLPLIVAQTFTPNTVSVGGTTTLTFSITNPNAGQALTNVCLNDTLQYVQGSAGTATVCGGTLTTSTTGIALTGATLAAGATCVFSVALTGAVPGSFQNTVAVSSTETGSSSSAPALANVTVLAPLGVTKTFAPTTVAPRGVSTVTFGISNPNAMAVGNIGFTDSLDPALVVATPSSAVSTCGGTLTATPGSSAITFAGGAVAGGGSCAVTVNIQTSTPGDFVDTVTVSSDAGATTASSELVVPAPPTVASSFAASAVAIGKTTTLLFSITNPNAGTTLTDVGFDDVLQNVQGIAGAPISISGGTLTTNTTDIVLTGATIAAGDTCSFGVAVTGAVPGWFEDQVVVGSTEGGQSAPALANVTVLAPLVVTKTFVSNTVGVGGISTLTFGITNPSQTAAVGNISFTDNLAPALVVATPSGATGTCGGTITAAPGSSTIAFSGGSVAASGSCAVSVNVLTLIAGEVIDHVTVSSDADPTVATGELVVDAPPTVVASFVPDTAAPGAPATLVITVGNPNATALSNVAVTNALPAGLTADPTSVTSDCPGLTDATTPTTVQFLVATLAAGATCTLSVDVTASTTGTFVGAILVTATESGAATGSASATLSVGPPLLVTQSFSPTAVAIGSPSTLTIVITNPNGTPLDSVSFSDTLPAGLRALAGSGADTCGGVVTTPPGQPAVVGYANGSIPANSNCVVTVNVAASVAGTFANNVAVSVLEPAASASASGAALTVIGPPATQTWFGPTPGATPDVLMGTVVPLTILVSNPNAATPLTNVSVSDALPSGVAVAVAGAYVASCGALQNATLQGGTVAFTLASLAAGASCSVVVNVAVQLPGTYVNSVAVSATESGAAQTTSVASVSAYQPAPPTVLLESLVPSITTPGAATMLLITIGNPNADDDLTNVNIFDPLTTGLVAMPLSATSNCAFVNGTTASMVQFTVPVLPAASVCDFTVAVAADSVGNYVNNVFATATESGAAMGAASATLEVVPALLVSQSFVPPAVAIGAASTLTIALTNPNGTPADGVVFANELPAGLDLVLGSGADTCGGTITTTVLPSGRSVLQYSNDLPPATSCVITAGVVANAAGPYVSNLTVNVADPQAVVGASGTLIVLEPLAVSQAFSPSAVPVGGTSTLTFVLGNPNQTTAVGNIGFTANIAPLVVAAAPFVSTCGGTLAATPGSSTIVFSGGAVAAGAQCTINVAVQAPATPGTLLVNAVAVESDAGVASSSGGTLVVVVPPTVLQTVAPNTAGPGAPVTLTITVGNPNSVALSNVSVTDVLPAAPGPLVANVATVGSDCPGVTTTTTPAVVQFLVPTLPAGGLCNLVVDVSATALGVYTNNVAATATESGAAMASASATLTVGPALLASKSFAPPMVAVNTPSTLTIVLTNPNGTAVDNVGFADVLPAGLQFVGSASDTCSGNVTTTTPFVLQYSNDSIPPSTNCVITVGVAASVANTYVDDLTVDVAGVPVASASSSLVVFQPFVPVPGVETSFATSTAFTETPVAMTIVVSNPLTNGIALTNVSVTDALPPGMTVALPVAYSSSCPVTSVNIAGSSVGFVVPSLALGASCSLVVNVVLNAAGPFLNTVSVTADQSSGQIGSSMASIVGILPPAVPSAVVAFSPPTVLAGATSTFIVTITNEDPVENLANVMFADLLPAGLQLVGGASATCGTVIVTTEPGGYLDVVYENPTMAPLTTCTVAVPVTATTAGSYPTTVSVFSDGDMGNPATGAATLTVTAPPPIIVPAVQKSFAASSIATNTPVALTIVVSNPLTNGVPLTNVSVTDALPPGMTVALPVAYSTSCPVTNANIAGSSVSFVAPSLAPGASCSLVVNVVLGAAGSFLNTVTATAAESGGQVASNTATIDGILPPEAPNVTVAFSPPTVLAGATSVFTVTITNEDSVQSLANVIFADLLPVGLQLAGTASATCGTVVVTTAAGGHLEVTYENPAMAPTTTCTVTVPVTATTAGSYPTTVSVFNDGDMGNPATGTATLTATAPPPVALPAVQKSFAASTILTGVPVPMTIVVSNPLANRVRLTNVSVTDSLPPGMTVAFPLTCSTTRPEAAVNVRGSTIQFTVPALAAGESCSLVVLVVLSTAGAYRNTVNATADQSGGKIASGTASITATAPVPPPVPPTVVITCPRPPVFPGAPLTCTVTITNNDRRQNLANVACSAILPRGLQVAGSATTPTNCGTVTANLLSSGLYEILHQNPSMLPATTYAVTVPVMATTTGAFPITVNLLYDGAAAAVTTTATVTVVALSPPSPRSRLSSMALQRPSAPQQRGPPRQNSRYTMRAGRFRPW